MTKPETQPVHDFALDVPPLDPHLINLMIAIDYMEWYRGERFEDLPPEAGMPSWDSPSSIIQGIMTLLVRRPAS